MNISAPSNRRQFLAGAAATVAATTLPGSRPAAAQSAARTVLSIATVGEPSTLDPIPSTAGLISEIDQHMFETLYVFDPEFRFAPVLAAAMPEISDDGKTYTIRLRQNVPFHDGTAMTADDVIATISRWLKVSPRGRGVAGFIDSFTAVDPHTVRFVLKQPYAPLVALLAFPNGMPTAMPKRIAEGPDPMTEFVGTGPYKLLDHKADAYVRVEKFDQYASPPGKPNGYAGERAAMVDELRFIPVPNTTTRVDGLLAGQYDFGDALSPETWARLKGQKAVQPGTERPATWVLLIFNSKQGVMSNPAFRRAALTAMSMGDAMAASFGDKSLWTLEGSIYPEGTDWFDAEAPGYNANDPDKAGQMLKAAGYKGQPVRIMVSPQYDYMFKTGQVAQASLEQAGFKIDLQVMDWATLLRRREDPAQWDGFVTSHGVVPDPSLITILNPSYPGWWDSAPKRAALADLLSNTDQAKRVASWRKLQALFYSEVPTIKVGSFYDLYGISTRLSGYVPSMFPAFWNVKES